MPLPTLPVPEAPGWTEDGDAFIVKVTEHWIVAVVPHIFNDRIQIATPSEYGVTWTAGWCFPREFHYSTLETVGIAGAWDPETQLEPLGYSKKAYDLRNGSLL